MSPWKRRLIGVLAGIGAAAGVSAASAAVKAVVTDNLSLRAGPGFDYPSTVRARAGEPVQIYACVERWAWCDVSLRGNRGWIAGQALGVAYRNQRVLVSQVGPRLGVPLTRFDIDRYWKQNYDRFAFYGQLPRYRQRTFSEYGAILGAPAIGGSNAPVLNFSTPNNPLAPNLTPLLPGSGANQLGDFTRPLIPNGQLFNGPGQSNGAPGLQLNDQGINIGGGISSPFAAPNGGLFSSPNSSPGGSLFPSPNGSSGGGLFSSPNGSLGGGFSSTPSIGGSSL